MYNQGPWGMPPQGFGGTPYPVFIPQPTQGGKPPTGKSLKKQFREWAEFQQLMTGQPFNAKKDDKKPDDKPKVPMYTFPQVLLVLWSMSIPVGFLSLYIYVQIAKSILPMVGSSIGIK